MKLSLVFLFIFSTKGINAREITAVFSRVPPVIDGRLNEECWQKTIPSGKFTRFMTNNLAEFQSSVIILCDEEKIYFGIDCQTSIPVSESIQKSTEETYPYPSALYAASYQKHTGFDYGKGEKIEIFLSPGLEHNKYCQFIVSTTGKVYTTMATGDLFHLGELPWESAFVGGEQNFTVEIAIPWAIFHLTKKTVDWTINICRVSAGTLPEVSCWNPAEHAFNNTSSFGKLIMPKEINFDEFVLEFKDAILTRLPPDPLQWRARISDIAGKSSDLSGKINQTGLVLDPFMKPGFLLELEICRSLDGKIIFQGAHQTEDLTKEIR